MSQRQAAEIADEHISWWKRRYHNDSKYTAQKAWWLLTGCRYRGGGWEAVRAEMVRWLLSQEAERPVVKRAA